MSAAVLLLGLTPVEQPGANAVITVVIAVTPAIAVAVKAIVIAALAPTVMSTVVIPAIVIAAVIAAVIPAMMMSGLCALNEKTAQYNSTRQCDYCLIHDFVSKFGRMTEILISTSLPL